MFAFIDTRFGRLVTLASALGAAALVGCDDGGSTPEPAPGGGSSAEVLRSDIEREANPAAGLDEARVLASDQNAFAVDLFQTVRGDHTNLFFSPLSIHQALGMTWAGARGETEAAMAATMHFSQGQAGLHPAANRLAWLLESRAEPIECEGEGCQGDPFALSVVNAIWGQTGYTFLPEFLDVLALNYGAGLRPLDFRADPEAARETINTWVEGETNDRIKNLLPQGSVGTDTRLVLTNAIYFKASWATEFLEHGTADAAWTLADGAEVQVPTMMAQGGFLGHTGEDYDAIRLPYVREQVSMLLVAPPAGELEAFEANLTAEGLQGIIDGFEPGSYEVHVPKFEFETDLPLTQPLIDLGMGAAFTGQADFSGMNGEGGLQITDVLHKAFVAIDEEGTEAAAATAVVVGETSAPAFDTLRFDRPFLFFIVDEPTGAVLFFGRMADPR